VTSSPLPPIVVDFVETHIRSLLQLESLLLVFESRDRPRTAADLSAEMYVPVDALTSWLDEFVRDGLCSHGADGYHAADDLVVHELLEEVAQAYVRRPVSMGRLIFGSARDDLVQLSDAFRLRKER
jgi:hypothetical protein